MCCILPYTKLNLVLSARVRIVTFATLFEDGDMNG